MAKKKKGRPPLKRGRKRWITLLKWLAKFALFASLILLVVCTAHITLRLCSIELIPTWLSSWVGTYQDLGMWSVQYAPGEVIRPIFVAMGLIHSSFALIITAREKRLYGVQLQTAMQKLFPSLGLFYAVHAGLILLGLYTSGKDYHLSSLVCLVGALISFCSTWIVTALFTFSRKQQQRLVEYYLCYHKYPSQAKKSKRDKTWEHILTSARYINKYYHSIQSVPTAVTLHAWQGLTITMTGSDLLPEDGRFRKENPDISLSAIQGTTQLIAAARTFWQTMLEDLSDEEQLNLIRQSLVAVVGSYSLDPPSKLNQPDIGKNLEATKLTGGPESFFTAPYRQEPFPPDYTELILPLSGLISKLRSCPDRAPSQQGYWDAWYQCFSYVYLISSVSPGARLSLDGTDSSIVEKFDFSVRLLFLLTLTVLFGELATLEPNDSLQSEDCGELWLLLDRLRRVFHVSFSWVPRFLPWGLSIIFSYGSDSFGSKNGILDLYDTYQWLSRILLNMTDGPKNDRR